METLSIIVGAVGTAFGFLSFQTKKQEHYLLAQVFCNLFSSASFLLLGPDRMGGGLLCFAAVFQALLNYRYMKKDQPIARWSVCLFFLIYAAITLVPVFAQGNIRIPYSFCPFFCAVTFLLSVSTKDSRVTRRYSLINIGIWILYDFLGETFPWSNFATHLMIGGSILVAMLRYRPSRKPSGEN